MKLKLKIKILLVLVVFLTVFNIVGTIIYELNQPVLGAVSGTVSMTVGFFCGDDVCNNAESCSTCSEDCGACPVTSTPSTSGGAGAGGGGGASQTTTEDTIDDETAEEIIDTKENTPAQEESTILDQLQDTLGICIPNIQCTPWQPSECKIGELIQRTCYDTNDCGDATNIETKYCKETILGLFASGDILGKKGAIALAKNLAGDAWTTNTQNLHTSAWMIILILLIAVFAPFVIYGINHRINIEYYLSDLHAEIDKSPIHLRVVIATNNNGSRVQILERIEFGQSENIIENTLYKL